MGSIALEIIQRNLEQFVILLPQSKYEFISYFQNFYDIIKKQPLSFIDVKTNLKQSLKIKEEKVNNQVQKLNKIYQFNSNELNFKNKIILHNCSLIIEHQQHHFQLLAIENDLKTHQITSDNNSFITVKQKIHEQLNDLTSKLNQIKLNNLYKEKQEQINWFQIKHLLSSYVIKYDTEMLELEKHLESIKNTYRNEETEMSHYKKLAAEQDELYHKVIKEKCEYLENEWQKKLIEFKVKMAQRKIVKFIEEYYPVWRKKKLKNIKKKSKQTKNRR